MESHNKEDIEAEQPLNPTKSLPDPDQNLLLFTEEQDAKRPTTASFLSRFADLNSLPPTMDPDSATAQSSAKKGADLGTLTGVFLPCIQNIFGVILFIRMVWIVGTAGVPLAFLVVLICCMVTFTTCISLSAIATNGIVPAGGSYFMISRALGPEFGGAVGLLFFLGTSVAAAMYITGAVEIILNYMAPEMALFGDFRTSTTILYHNIRVYGTCFVAICGLLVFIGVKFVSKIAPVALLCVILSILSIYGGVFINYEGTDDVFCSLGDRIMAVPVEHCTKNASDTQSLFHRFCLLKDNSSANYVCDDYYEAHEPSIRKAVPGIASGVLQENIEPRFRTKGDLIDYGDGKYDANKPRYANILVDITTSFTMFVAIYFPSCTGILAGSNRSGDLKDGQKSIPTGTLAAQLVTSFVYLSSVVLFGAAFNNLFIRDKFGECMVSVQPFSSLFPAPLSRFFILLSLPLSLFTFCPAHSQRELVSLSLTESFHCTGDSSCRRVLLHHSPLSSSLLFAPFRLYSLHQLPLSSCTERTSYSVSPLFFRLLLQHRLCCRRRHLLPAVAVAEMNPISVTLSHCSLLWKQ